MSLEVRKWLENPNDAPIYKCLENLVCLILGGGATGLLVLGISSRWEIQRLPSRLAAEMQRLEVTLLGGHLGTPPGRVGGEELGFFWVLKVPKSQANQDIISPENGWLEDEISF